MASSEKSLADAGSAVITTSDYSRAVAAALDSGIDPDAVGRLAIDHINAGRFWLIPQPELTFETMDPRFEAMKRGALYSGPDWPPPG